MRWLQRILPVSDGLDAEPDRLAADQAGSHLQGWGVWDAA